MILLIGVLGSALYSFGYRAGFSYAERQASFLTSKDFSKDNYRLFWNTWANIKEHYIDQDKIKSDKAALEAARGLVRSLNDPYSDLFSPSQAKIFEEDLSGGFGGVGMEIGFRKGALTVIAPLEGTPADRAGIKAGDLILKIDNVETANLTLEEAVSKIRGQVGTKVKLLLMREGWPEPRDFEIVRAKIEVQAVKSKLLEPGIGYIKLNTFNIKTVPEFVSAFNTLNQQGVQRYILDLRNNPGGFLEVAIQMAEFYVPRGQVILKELWGKEKRERMVRSEGPGSLANSKTVIMVNRGSASASEIFAAALRDNLKIKLVGEKTFGKGSVQEVFKTDGYLLKLTIAYWLTPLGERLEGTGLEPDIKVTEAIEGEAEDKKDPVLNKAVEVVKQL